MSEEATEKVNVPPKANTPKAGWRIKTGFAIFIASVTWPVLLPILPLFGFSNQAVAKFTVAMFVAAELMMVAAAAISGKSGFAYIKQRLFGWLKSYGPPETVSPGRYKTGLVLFFLPLLYALLSPYIRKYIPGIPEYGVAYAIVGDIMLLAGLFMLGGNFWRKLRALFVHKAVAVVPDQAVG